MKLKYQVFNEEWEKPVDFDTLREAEAFRYQEHGYSGYILLIDTQTGEELANCS